MLSTDLNYILIQLFQPYFYYSTILLVVSFICVKALMKYNGLLTARIRSLCCLFPLTIPVLLSVLVSSWFITRLLFKISISYNLHNSILAMPLDPRMIMPPSRTLNHFWPIDNSPVTNMLLAIGLTLSVFYLLATITLSGGIVKRIFRIVELEPGEYESLQRKINELSKKLDIESPKIGLMEDLRPNAFTIGYGRRTMLVFSLGILKTLKEKELAAVATHELAHVKNNDFLFKTVSVALTLLSFFNPFAYFASATAQREREILADEEGARILGQPRLLAKTLVKIYEASRAFPKEGIIARLASGLFLSSPTSVRSMLLSTHPRLDQRVENIRRLDNRREPARVNPLLSITISTIIITAGIMSTYYLASIRSSFIRQYFPTMLFEMPLEERNLIPAHGGDNMEKLRVFGFFRFRNTLPNDFNELCFKIMVLKMEESGPDHHSTVKSRFNIYSLKV
ncbi:MAG: M48 family metallopeptidase [Thermoproteota archaeon]